MYTAIIRFTVGNGIENRKGTFSTYQEMVEKSERFINALQEIGGTPYSVKYDYQSGKSYTKKF